MDLAKTWDSPRKPKRQLWWWSQRWTKRQRPRTSVDTVVGSWSSLSGKVYLLFHWSTASLMESVSRLSNGKRSFLPAELFASHQKKKTKNKSHFVLVLSATARIMINIQHVHQTRGRGEMCKYRGLLICRATARLLLHHFEKRSRNFAKQQGLSPTCGDRQGV